MQKIYDEYGKEIKTIWDFPKPTFNPPYMIIDILEPKPKYERDIRKIVKGGAKIQGVFKRSGLNIYMILKKNSKGKKYWTYELTSEEKYGSNTKKLNHIPRHHDLWIDYTNSQFFLDGLCYPAINSGWIEGKIIEYEDI